MCPLSKRSPLSVNFRSKRKKSPPESKSPPFSKRDYFLLCGSPLPKEKPFSVWISLLKKNPPIFLYCPFLSYMAASPSMECFLSFWDMYVDIWKVNTCGSHWRLSQRCSPRLGLGKVDCAFLFLKMWKGPPLVTCDSLRECVEIHSFFWCVQCLESVWCVLAGVWAFFQHGRVYFFNGMYLF